MTATKFIRSQRAAAMVEFAIVLPVLLLLVFGIIDFGRALYTLNNLTSAVREGARLGSVQSTPNTAAIQQRVSDYLTPFGWSSVPSATVTEVPSATNPEYITVEIRNFPFEPITPIAGMIGLGSIPISASASFRWEFGG